MIEFEEGETTGIGQEFTFKAFHNGRFKNKEHVDNGKHEHDWRVIFRCKAKKLNEENVVLDFRFIDKIKEQLENKYLNELEIFEGQTVTTEFLARWIRRQIPRCFLVEVFETEKNHAWNHKKLNEDEY